MPLATIVANWLGGAYTTPQTYDDRNLDVNILATVDGEETPPARPGRDRLDYQLLYKHHPFFRR